MAIAMKKAGSVKRKITRAAGKTGTRAARAPTTMRKRRAANARQAGIASGKARRAQARKAGAATTSRPSTA